MPSRPRFALCTAISPSHHCKQTSTPVFPGPLTTRLLLFADRPSQFALTAIAAHSPVNLSIPTPPPRPFETRAPPTALRCCTAATRNPHSTSPPCRTAAAADQTSPNQSINQASKQSINRSTSLPSIAFSPTSSAIKGVARLPAATIGKARQSSQPIRSCKERLIALHAFAYISSASPLRRTHLRKHTDARRLSTAAKVATDPKRGCVPGNQRGRGHHKQQPVSATVAHRPPRRSARRCYTTVHTPLHEPTLGL